MTLIDTAAKTVDLRGVYGSARGSGAPATLYLAIFADSGFTTELTGTGGIPRIPISNVDAQLVTSGNATSNVNQITSSASTGTWASSGQYACLMDTASGAGVKYDGGALTSPVNVGTAGTTVTIAPGQLQITA